MNKTRIEGLSDGVFSIVMTLLILDIKVPQLNGVSVTNQELWQRLADQGPIFRSYFISFVVIGMYWISHHAFFHLYARQVNRVVANINIVFLMFLAFIPFSAHLLGEYHRNEAAIAVYGMNIIGIGLALFSMFRIVIRNKELAHENVSRRLIIQGTIRVLLPPGFALLAIFAAYVNIPFSLFLFAFPVIFNIIPGTLDFLERLVLQRKNKF